MLAAGEGGLEVHKLRGAPGAATPNPLEAGRSGLPKKKNKEKNFTAFKFKGLVD
jgi:hypothetical protein